MRLLLVIFVGSGLVLIGIAIPLIERRIKPNPWYGFRVRATLENPEVWYDVNAYAGRRLLVSGFITALAALLLFLIPGIDPDTYALGSTGISVVAISISLAQSFQYLRQRTPPKPPMDF
jgi:hypothetical protein